MSKERPTKEQLNEILKTKQNGEFTEKQAMPLRTPPPSLKKKTEPTKKNPNKETE